MKKLIVANWKMNPGTLTQAEGLYSSVSQKVKNLNGVEVVVCPPFTYIDGLARLQKRKKSRVRLGAQDTFWKEGTGAYTGEVSPRMLKAIGAQYVIIGHSERRQFLRETDKDINCELRAALSSGMKVILCVGEPLSVRRKGLTDSRRYVRSQIIKALKGIENWKSKIGNSLVVAYEPIWAISTTKNQRDETPEDAANMAQFIRGLLNSKFKIPNSKILYGGSVNTRNARSFMGRADIDGALVGGASLKSKSFVSIIKSAL